MSEESMVERVARAMCADDFDRTVIADHPRDFWVDHHWKAWEPSARAAIAEMREPSKEMVHPDGTAIPYFDYHRSDDAAAIWRAMIDAAL